MHVSWMRKTLKTEAFVSQDYSLGFFTGLLFLSSDEILKEFISKHWYIQSSILECEVLSQATMSQL